MLNISELGSWIEEIESLFLVVLAIVEVGIDLVYHNRRSYRDTVANIVIATVYTFSSATIGYFCVFEFQPKNLA